MDKVKFATLIAYIQRCINQGGSLGYCEIEEMDKIIIDGTTPNKALCGNVDNLMEAMNKGELILAIKSYRTLTGMTLKDSKEAVERVMVGINQRQELRTIAADMRHSLKDKPVTDNLLEDWINVLDRITG